MPIETTIVVAGLFVMFGAFVLILGGVSLWVALGDRRDRRERAAVRFEAPPRHEEMRRAA